MYKYTHLIPENIAPVGAQKIGFYDGNGRRVGEIGVGKLSSGLSKEDKLYSFCAISDVHIGDDTSVSDFQNALTFAKNNCDFTFICGDLTKDGTDAQLSQYKSIVNTYAKSNSVYAIVGNHENYSYYEKTRDITDYTGYPLYYTISNQPTDVSKKNYYCETVGNDVYVMCGCYEWYLGDTQYKGHVFHKDYLQWLYKTLEDNRDKRCFVFSHVFPFNDGVGNVKVNGKWIYTLDLWTSEEGYDKVFENLMAHYKNTVLFHGHSHLKFDLQEVDKNVNYAYVKKGDGGYRSIHIPSLATPRDIAGSSYTPVSAESEGYIVDVYDDCIVLNGMDFGVIDLETNERTPTKQLGIATYKIDTTFPEIPATTLKDIVGDTLYKNVFEATT